MSTHENSAGVREAVITAIELTPVFVPFYEYVRQAMQAGAGGLGMAIAAEEEWLGGDYVICKLTSEDGSVGLGEAFVWLPETGVSPEQLIDSIKNALSNYVHTEPNEVFPGQTINGATDMIIPWVGDGETGSADVGAHQLVKVWNHIIVPEEVSPGLYTTPNGPAAVITVTGLN